MYVCLFNLHIVSYLKCTVLINTHGSSQLYLPIGLFLIVDGHGSGTTVVMPRNNNKEDCE